MDPAERRVPGDMTFGQRAALFGLVVVAASAPSVSSADEPTQVWRIPLRYADAGDVAGKLREILGPGAAHAGVWFVGADATRNQVVIVATEHAYTRIRDLLRPCPSAAGSLDADAQVHVIALSHANAREVLRALHQVVAEHPRARVAADDPTNAIIVVSDGGTYAEIRRVVARMDRRRSSRAHRSNHG